MDYLTKPRQFARSGPVPRLRYRLWGSVAVAAVLAVTQASPAFATIDNTATVNGTGPSGPMTPVTDEVHVDVIDAAPATTVSKSWAFVAGPTGDVNGDGNVDPGDQVIYTYTVTNAGNVTLQDVSLSDAHDGVNGALVFTNPTVVTTDFVNADPLTSGDSQNSDGFGDGVWDVLGPGDVITFTSTYTAGAGDFTAPASSDGDIDNTATVAAMYNGSAVTPSTGTASVPLDSTPRFTLDKVADDITDRAVGDVVTYTYTIENTGNVPIGTVTLADVENGSGSLTGPNFDSWGPQNGSVLAGNTITTFNPGSVAIYKSTYTVTQNDVDMLQAP